MKNQLKILSVMAIALALVFSSAGVSSAFSTPDLSADCHKIESGLGLACDPVTSLRIVNSTSQIIPVTGSFPAGLATSLRGINDLALSEDDLSLSDFGISVKSPVATSLRGLNVVALSAPATSLRAINDFVQSTGEKKLAMPAAFYFGAR
jgi:hypothetical protein